MDELSKEIDELQSKIWPQKKITKVMVPDKAMLLCKDLQIDSKIVNKILEGWFEMQSKLQFDQTIDLIPMHLSIQQIYVLTLRGDVEQEDNTKDVPAYTRVHKIFIVADLWLEGVDWQSEQ